ncbi:MAG TPA: GvpL/GvpF family gas vesicle protein [Pyrinomonadaceae bacterium]|jgi:hypothetical protein|nr:GvpL/GvpF family gas vesicle protein [Pyrinomonadaceae bacterium]
MKKSVNKKSRSDASAARETRKPDRSQVFYVYCVGERDALDAMLAGELPPAIESGASLETVGGGELAAVVSGVAASDYGEATLEARLADAQWTAARAMRHEQVVEYFAARASVVPLRFGTIYLERARVEAMLKERDAELRSIIARLRGRDEWGVNVFCDRAQLKERIAAVSPRLRELLQQAEQASPGQSYLMRKKVESLRADETRVESKRIASDIERALAAASEGAARLRVLKGEAAEHGELTAKLAYLVARERFPHFRAEAERLAAAHAALGFRMELTGPWPAYNFASGIEQDEEPIRGKG